MRKQTVISLVLALCMLFTLFTGSVYAVGETRDTAADGFYLVGTHNDWNDTNPAESLKFRPSIGANSEEYVLETELTLGQKFKVVKLDNGVVTDYPDNGFVFEVTEEYVGPAIIYFRETRNSDWANSGGYFWVGGKPAISYVDADGETKSCENYTTATFAGDVWSGWIVLTEDVTVGSRIEVENEAHVILEDGKTLAAEHGIHVPDDASLTIYGQAAGTGALNADYSQLDILNFFESDEDYEIFDEMMNGAVIGGNFQSESGHITINGGKVTAIHQEFYGSGSGIGGGSWGSLSAVTINGGTVVAKGGGDSSDGIGCGNDATQTPDILITGGNVTAEGSGSGAGIGCYGEASVMIKGGEVCATGGTSDGGVGASGIGGNYGNVTAGSITITGGKITALGGTGQTHPTYSTGGAGIGGAYGGGFASITITGGIINATGGKNLGTGIGVGASVHSNEIGPITITGGQITAVGGKNEDELAAPGIGGSDVFENADTTIITLCKISLGWTDAENDFIHSSGYDGEVKLEKDFMCADKPTTVFRKGEVKKISSLAEVKLVPYLAFTDVRDPQEDYFEPVYWAYFHEPRITSGVSATRFNPSDTCTRAQVVTFLWRAAGKPEPTNTGNPFTDVSTGAYYYKPVLWAVEKKITSGISSTRFNPNGICTRAQVVTFLWRAAEKPEPASTENPFTDVSARTYYYKAVLWAAEKGILSETGGSAAFGPDTNATRGEVVTFLCRAMNQPENE